MLFQAHNKRRELEETWQNEEDTVVVQKHPGTEKLLPLCEAKSHKAVHAPFTIAITQQSGLSCFVNTTVKQKVLRHRSAFRLCDAGVAEAIGKVSE